MERTMVKVKPFLGDVQATLNPTESQRLDSQTGPIHVHCMPPELLVKVFCYDINNFWIQYDTSQWLWAQPRMSAWRAIQLSSVCTYWRETVVETSSFWSNVLFDANNDGLDGIASLCLERSSNHLLDITVIAAMTSTDYRPWDPTRCLTLKNLTHRIRSLSLLANGPSAFPNALLLQFFQSSPLTSLSELLVEYCPNPWPTITSNNNIENLTNLSPPAGANCLASLKQLHVLELKHVHIDWKQYSFDQLRILKVTGRRSFDSVEQLAHILSTSPCLQTLSISSFLSFKNNPTLVVQSTPLPKLRNVHLDCMEFNTLCTILCVLPPGPYNMSLSLSSSGFDNAFELSGGAREKLARVSSLFVKFPNITTLDVDITFLDLTHPYSELQNSLHQIICMLPNLSTLTLKGATIDKHVISCLTPPSDENQSTSPFPRISILKLHYVKLLAIQEFKDMLTRYPLKQIELDRCDFEGVSLPRNMLSSQISTGSDHAVVCIRPGSEFHHWLLKTVPRVSVIHWSVDQHRTS